MTRFFTHRATGEGTVVQEPSPSFMETVQYASLLHPTMIRMAFKSIRGGGSFAGGSEIDYVIPVNAGTQRVGRNSEAYCAGKPAHGMP